MPDYCAASFTGMINDTYQHDNGIWFKLSLHGLNSYYDGHKKNYLPAFWPQNLMTFTPQKHDKVFCFGRLRQYSRQYNETADRAPSLILVCEIVEFIRHVPITQKPDPPSLGGLRTECGGPRTASSDAHNIDADWNPFNPDLTWWGDR